MIEKFEEFLAGSPNWFDEGQRVDWDYLVGVILPKLMREWYDPDFKDDDLWTKGKAGLEKAQGRLAALNGFRKRCGESSRVLRALKLIIQFHENETRKKGLGKTTRKSVRAAVATTQKKAPAQAPKIVSLEEGDIVECHFSRHERNPKLRRACIEHFRLQNKGRIACAACEMAFAERYGQIGEGYIEVHQLSPVSQVEGVHEVDPTKDLVPLCANCHAMIHRLMAEAKKGRGCDLEGRAALDELRRLIIEGHTHGHA